TLGILGGLARGAGRLGLVHWAAHPDTWDEYFGSKYFHGTPFRRAVEENLIDPRRMIQVGIRGPLYGSEDFEFHDRDGIQVARIEAVKEEGAAWVGGGFARLRGGPGLCSVALGAIAPAFGPGTGMREVGGLTSYEALVLVRALVGQNLIGADIVEVSPPYDGPGQITALMGANLLFELVSLLALSK